MSRIVVLGSLISALVLLGLATFNGAVLALALPLLIYLGAGALGLPGEPRLRAERRLSADRIAQGHPVVVTLVLVNEGPRLAHALIEDRYPRALELVDGSTSALAALAPGASVEMTYTLRGRRGFYEFGDAQVTASDPFGLLKRVASVAAPARLFVMPRAGRLQRAAIRPRRTQVYAGSVPVRQGGPGVEFFGVREYQPGDSTRHVNARATARHTQALFVNEFEQERVADVGLILDARARGDARSGQESIFEYAVEAAAVLADTFLDHGNRVGLLIYGNALDWTFPGYGKLQRERVMRALARAEPGDRAVFENLEDIPTRLFPARSQLVLISPLVQDDARTIVSLRARGYHVLVISPDPVSFERRGMQAGRAVELATRIAHLERALLLRQIQQAGALVVDWQVERPFQQVAQTALWRSPVWARSAGLAP